MRSVGYRWFVDPAASAAYPADEREVLSRVYVAGLREIATLRGQDSYAHHLVEMLTERSAEFRDLWERHEVGIEPPPVKRFLHPHVGSLELRCQTLIDPEQSQRLLVYTAEPGSESHDKLRLVVAIEAPVAR